MEQFRFPLKNKVLIVQLVNFIMVLILLRLTRNQMLITNLEVCSSLLVIYLSISSEIAIIAKDYRNVAVVFVLFRRNVWDPQIADDHLYQNGPRIRLCPQDRIMGQEEDRIATKTSTLLWLFS